MATKILLHCNKCFTRILSNNQRLYIANCGHTLCANCAGHTAINKTCAVCDMAVSLLQVDRMLPAHHFRFFQPLDALYATVKRILNFQMEQRCRMEKTLTERTIIVKNAFHSLLEQYKALKAINNRKKQIIQNKSHEMSRGLSPHNSMNTTNAFGIRPQSIYNDKGYNETALGSIFEASRGNGFHPTNSSRYIPSTKLFGGVNPSRNIN